jgi:shikimate 5-dehydrogenase
MLIHQAAAQFELYTGRPAPLEPMEEALRAAIGPAN